VKKLVGEGKPFHSALDKAAGLLKRKVGTGAEFMKELQGLGGIKQAEIDERKLGEITGMPKMTHEQFLSALQSRPAPAIREKVLGGNVDRAELQQLTQKKLRQIALEELSREGYTQSQIKWMLSDRINELELSDRLVDIEDSAYQELTSKPAHHKTYTLPGGENYREMLIKAPQGVDNQEKIMELEAKLRRIPCLIQRLSNKQIFLNITTK
jgi:hypothetical protein